MGGKPAMARLPRTPMIYQGPEVVCIACGRVSAIGMGMIASPITEPHRWMCRNRRRCLAQAGLRRERRATDRWRLRVVS